MWPPFGEELLIRLIVRFMSFCNFGYVTFRFQGRGFGSDRTSSWSLLTFLLFIKMHVVAFLRFPNFSRLKLTSCVVRKFQKGLSFSVQNNYMEGSGSATIK